ncbi:acylphosphatase [Fusarium heterosporum]|uniref:acylphosphatase n=1 Tax=Fusarium heterosporum TaxID=42747 RepID=A0A8H5WSD5_FUSHE|nr:acylphosphatase [Fusarium heterosporum]
MTKRVFFAVEGRVQGVGFRRYFTQKKAQEYGITGWCRNTKDEKVEGEAQADEEILSKFFKDVDNGPGSARVTKVSQEERQLIDGENDFVVTR